MTAFPEQSRAGHAFISYVREDSASIDKLQEILDTADIPVWRDTEDLWPGEDWRLKIRQAITKESLVFIACFSKNSNARETTYQNEELLLAVEQLRRRSPGSTPWLIPVRLDDCTIPEFDIGAGRYLSSLQVVDLFGEKRETATSRLIATIMRILNTAAPGMPVTAKMDGSSEAVVQVKEMLLDPTKRIKLDDLITTIVNDCRKALMDEKNFPLQHDGDQSSLINLAVSQAEEYWKTTKPVLEILAAGCTWGEVAHERLWSATARSIANSVKPAGGKTLLINLRKLPALTVLYTAGMAAIHGENYGALRAVAMDAKVRTEYRGEIPLIGNSHTWRPFEDSELLANILSYRATDLGGEERSVDTLFEKVSSGKIPKRYTPVSDYLHASMRGIFEFLIPDTEDYTETFDKLEVLLSALAIDYAKTAEGFADGPWFGSFTWRSEYSRITAEGSMRDELLAESASWPPLRAKLFGGSFERASSAFETLVVEAQRKRQRQF